MSSGLSPDNAAVIVSVTEAISELYEETVDLNRYRWDRSEVLVAAAESKVDPAITLLFTLGSMMVDTILVAPTDGDPMELGSALAQVEAHFAKRDWRAHYGHFSSMDHPYLAERGRAGLVTASPMGLTAFGDSPSDWLPGKGPMRSWH